MRPLILLSNDDGVHAAGIKAALEALRPIADVIVSAPDREQSATSHSISLFRPLRAEEVGPGVFAVDGTPVDCVYLALIHLAGGNLPAVMNVNLPGGDVREHEITYLGRRVYRDLVDARKDLHGRAYYWIGGPELDIEDAPGSDVTAVRGGRASVTPLQLDLTATASLDDLRTWRLDLKPST